MKAKWVLYWRPWPGKRRVRFMEFDNEGEASANLCHAVMHHPGHDWKLRKVTGGAPHDHNN